MNQRAPQGSADPIEQGSVDAGSRTESDLEAGWQWQPSREPEPPATARADWLSRVRFVLVRPRGSLNIGLTARALKNMGIGRLDLVAPPHYREGIARSMCSRAEDVLGSMHIWPDLAEALGTAVLVAGTTARQGETRGPFLSPRQLAQRFSATRTAGDLVVVLGPEDHGLSGMDLDHCPLRVAIPADPAYPSLNLAQAAQVLAYELWLAAIDPGSAPIVTGEAPATEVPEAQRATRGELEGFYRQLEELLIQIGFLNPQNPWHIQTSLRRLFDRAHLDPREVRILRGICSNIKRLLGS